LAWSIFSRQTQDLALDFTARSRLYTGQLAVPVAWLYIGRHALPLVAPS